jgi:hypothetical protein
VPLTSASTTDFGIAAPLMLESIIIYSGRILT